MLPFADTSAAIESIFGALFALGFLLSGLTTTVLGAGALPPLFGDRDRPCPSCRIIAAIHTKVFRHPTPPHCRR